MYYQSVDSRFHAALWSCRERFACQIYSQSPITQFLQGPITMHGKCMYSPLYKGARFDQQMFLRAFLTEWNTLTKKVLGMYL